MLNVCMIDSAAACGAKRAVGIDVDPMCIGLAHRALENESAAELQVEFIEKNFLEADISDATVGLLQRFSCFLLCLLEGYILLFDARRESKSDCISQRNQF